MLGHRLASNPAYSRLLEGYSLSRTLDSNWLSGIQSDQVGAIEFPISVPLSPSRDYVMLRGSNFINGSEAAIIVQDIRTGSSAATERVMDSRNTTINQSIEGTLTYRGPISENAVVVVGGSTTDNWQFSINNALRFERAARMKAEVLVRLEAIDINCAEEGFSITTSSREDFLKFLERTDVTRKPSIAAIETGTLRSVWKNDDREQVALNFLSNHRVIYVFFYLKDGKMVREYDEDDTFAIPHLLSARKLWRLMSDER